MKKKILIFTIMLLCVFCIPFATYGCNWFKDMGDSGNQNSENTENSENPDNEDNADKPNPDGNNGTNDAESGDNANNADSNNAADNDKNEGEHEENKDDGKENYNGGNNGSDTNNAPAKIRQYTVYTENASGARINGVTVKLKKDGKDVASKVATAGYAQFGVAEDDYELCFENLPEGYYADPSYTATKLPKDGSAVHAKFKTKVIDEPLTSAKNYKQGDIIHNFSFTDADGTTVELKEILKTHKLVLLNFWYDGCMYCEQELPAIESAYRNYKNDVFVISVSNRDSNSNVKRYKTQHGCTFFMAADRANIVSGSFVKVYPTNAIIDNCGIIRFIDYGSRPQQSFWESKFAELISNSN